MWFAAGLLLGSIISVTVISLFPRLVHRYVFVEVPAYQECEASIALGGFENVSMQGWGTELFSNEEGSFTCRKTDVIFKFTIPRLYKPEAYRTRIVDELSGENVTVLRTKIV